MRLIDADTIPWEGFPNDFGEYHEDYVEKRVVDKMPTIEARPVVRGEWDDRGSDMRCPVCGAEFDADIVNMCRDDGKSAINFCGNCGADMRGIIK